MNFDFSKGLENFTPTQNCKAASVLYQKHPVIHCCCTSNGDNIGIVRRINLPYFGKYKMSIKILPNNARTYLMVTDQDNNKITPKFKYLTKNNMDEIKLTFSASQIKISILMGGDSIVVKNDSFLLFELKINPIRENQHNNSSTLKITKVFSTISELKKQEDQIEPGEYAILKTKDSPDQLYIMSSSKGLVHTSNIGPGKPDSTILSGKIKPEPGKRIPIYKDAEEAKLKLREDPEGFYLADHTVDYNWDSVKNEIYLYLDSNGYVRWLRK